MNKVILMGRLTRDPEVRYSNSQSSDGNQLAIARYTLAVDRRFARRNGANPADQQTAEIKMVRRSSQQKLLLKNRNLRKARMQLEQAAHHSQVIHQQQKLQLLKQQVQKDSWTFLMESSRIYHLSRLVYFNGG